MNCGNCGGALELGNEICPNCGAKNILPSVEPTTVINLQEEENVPEEEQTVITEFMAPPELSVSNEDLTSNASDISSVDEVSTYDPEAEKRDIEAEIEARKKLEEDKVDIAIPAVQAPTEVSDIDDAGEVPEVSTTGETVGDNLNAIKENIKNGKLKIKLGGKTSNSILVIACVLFLIIGLLVGKILFSKNYCAAVGNYIVDEKVKFVRDGKNNTTNVGKYTYQIPKDYIYDRADKGVYIYDKEDKFRIYIKTETGLYKDLVGSKTSMKESMKEQKLDIQNVKEIKNDKRSLLVFEASKNGANRLICFTDAGNDHVYYIEIIDIQNNYNYDVIPIAADIADNATYQEIETKMESMELVDVSKVSINSSILQKAYEQSVN